MPLWLAIVVAIPVSFELPDARGKLRPLLEWNKHPIVVVAFIGDECPVARQYATKLDEIQRDFGPRGVAVIGIDANPDGKATGLSLEYSVLRDVGQSLMSRLG